MPVMKLSDFITSDEQEMKQAVLHKGILVAKRRISDCLVFLFQIDDYYVETYCSLENKKVIEYRAFSNLHALDPYLELIEIDKLLD